ncbi:MAG: hypothetical protein WC343_03705 [Bacilli bacterium]|jgi:hypothetical protein
MPITLPVPINPIQPLDLRRKSLNYNEQNRLNRDIKALEKDINNANNGISYIPSDVLEEMHKQLNKKKKKLDINRTPQVAGAEKDRLWQRAKDLEEQIKARQLTKKELFEENPNKIHEITCNYMEKYDEIVRIELEYKEIMRRLEPDNPNITNLARFRR